MSLLTPLVVRGCRAPTRGAEPERPREIDTAILGVRPTRSVAHLASHGR